MANTNLNTRSVYPHRFANVTNAPEWSPFCQIKWRCTILNLILFNNNRDCLQI